MARHHFVQERGDYLLCDGCDRYISIDDKNGNCSDEESGSSLGSDEENERQRLIELCTLSPLTPDEEAVAQRLLGYGGFKQMSIRAIAGALGITQRQVKATWDGVFAKIARYL